MDIFSSKSKSSSKTYNADNRTIDNSDRSFNDDSYTDKSDNSFYDSSDNSFHDSSDNSYNNDSLTDSNNTYLDGGAISGGLSLANSALFEMGDVIRTAFFSSNEIVTDTNAYAQAATLSALDFAHNSTINPETKSSGKIAQYAMIAVSVIGLAMVFKK